MNERRDPNVTSDYLPSEVSQGSTKPESPAEGDTKGFVLASDAKTNPDLPQITGYRVTREIARGGMGRVLAAIDTTLDRDVAIKILLPGAPPDRFIRESQITARLPHPGIPPVYSLGTLPDSSPYLAMKLIDGRTLISEIKAGDRQQLLQIFLQICQAVGFAHSRGVIHRDLKPANVMVGAFGEVQVMDWGLAKELASSETSPPAEFADKRVGGDTIRNQDSPAPVYEQTELGVVLGTPSYMSPEQARGERLDARVDVFALGGILLSILTKSPPFMGNTSAEVVKKAASGELSEAFRKLESCEADAELIAICRKCLSPSAADRPDDGQAVATAISSYLSNLQTRLRDAEISTAQAKERETAAKRTRKIQLIAASLVFTALAVGLGISLWQYREATKALNRALFAEGEEKKRSGELSKSRELEKKRADDLVKSQSQEKQRADELSQVAKYQAEMLNQINPKEAGILLMKDLVAQYRKTVDKLELSDEEKTARKANFEKELYSVNPTDAAVELIDSVILAPAIKTVDVEFANQPLVDAKLRTTVAAAYAQLGRPSKAVPLFQKSYELVSVASGPTDVDSLGIRLQLADNQRRIQHPLEAEPNLRAVLEEYKKQFGEDDENTLRASQYLALFLRDQGKYDECELIAHDVLKRRLRAHPNDAEKLSDAIADLGEYQMLNGKYDDALKLLGDQLELERRERTPSPGTLKGLGSVLLRKKKFEKAEPLLRELYEFQRNKHGYEHPNTVAAMQSLASCLADLQKFGEAESLARQALSSIRQMQGNEHFSTLTCVNVLAQVLRTQEKAKEAEECLIEAYQTGKRVLPPNHPELIVFTYNLGSFYQKMRRFKDADPLMRESLEKNRLILGDEHPYTIQMTREFADLLRQSNNNIEAEKHLRQAIQGLTNNAGGKLNSDIIGLVSTLGSVCRDQGKLTEAEECFQQALDWNHGYNGPDHSSTILAQLRMASLKFVQQKHAEVIEMLEPLDGKISKAFQPPAGDLRQASLKGLLGKSKAALAKNDADFKLAEIDLLQTRAVFNTLRGDKDKETVEWTQALVDFYTKWNEAMPNAGHDKSAEIWKAKLTP